jgi:hypothetical protein
MTGVKGKIQEPERREKTKQDAKKVRGPFAALFKDDYVLIDH